MQKNANKTIKKETLESKPKSIQPNIDVVDLPVVGIGASAGGLEALEGFFSHLTPNIDVAFIVVTHQMPGHLSLLPDLLAGFTAMPVVPVKSGMLLKKSHVYVCPPGKNLAILNRRLHLMERAE